MLKNVCTCFYIDESQRDSLLAAAAAAYLQPLKAPLNALQKQQQQQMLCYIFHFALLAAQEQQQQIRFATGIHRKQTRFFFFVLLLEPNYNENAK